MKGEAVKKAMSELTQAQRTEIEALAALAEARINTRDIPEQRDWRGARRGLFFPAHQSGTDGRQSASPTPPGFGMTSHE